MFPTVTPPCHRNTKVTLCIHTCMHTGVSWMKGLISTENTCHDQHLGLYPTKWWKIGEGGMCMQQCHLGRCFLLLRRAIVCITISRSDPLHTDTCTLRTVWDDLRNQWSAIVSGMNSSSRQVRRDDVLMSLAHGCHAVPHTCLSRTELSMYLIDRVKVTILLPPPPAPAPAPARLHEIINELTCPRSLRLVIPMQKPPF